MNATATFARIIRRSISSSVLLLLLTLAWPDTAPAQTLQQRRDLATRINTALAALTDSTSPQIVSIGGLGTIKLRNIDGGCDDLTANNEILVTWIDATTFELSVVAKDTATMLIPPNSHTMVCDLNGWLWHSWGIHYKDSMWGSKLGMECKADCDTCTQIYFMGETPTMQDAGMGTYLARTYSMPIGPRVGNTLFDADLTNRTYIGKYIPGSISSRDTAIGKKAYAYVEFPIALYDDGVRPRLKSLEITARTQRYTPDCYDSTWTPSSPYPSPGSFPRVKLTVVVYNDLANNEVTYTCEKTFPAGVGTSGIDTQNGALWSFFDWNNHFRWIWGEFGIDEVGYLYYRSFGNGCFDADRDTIKVFQIRDPKTPKEFCKLRFCRTGQFIADSMSGEIVYLPAMSCLPNTKQTVPCFTFCDPMKGYLTMTGVIDASAQTMSEDWPYDSVLYGTGASGSNRYEKGQDGKWRPNAHYSYKTRILKGHGPTASTFRNYNDAGVFVTDAGSMVNAFRIFDWQNIGASMANKWIQLDSTTMASPFAQALEERDITGIYTTVKFSHRNTVPKLVAKNARQSSVDFESFEDNAVTGPNLTPRIAHTGRYSYRLPPASSVALVQNLKITRQVAAEGLLVKAWVKKSYNQVNMHPNVPIAITASSTVSPICTLVTQTGEWTLYESWIQGFSIADTGATMSISFQSVLPAADTVWVDDIRVQPLGTQMTCYVYDPRLLLSIASFDDDHFAEIFQYNGEGQLIRKIRETERGVQLVAETQYHTPQWQFRNGTPAPGIAQSIPTPSFGIGRGTLDAPDGSVEPELDRTFDILDIELGTGGAKTKVFGQDDPELPSIDSLRAPNLDDVTPRDLDAPALPDVDALEAPAIPAIERVELLDEARALSTQISDLDAKQHAEGLTDAERQELERSAEELKGRRNAILRERLGLSQEEADAVIESFKGEDEP